MRPTCRSFGEGAAAMFIEGTCRTGGELAIAFMFARLERFCRKERDLLIQNGTVTADMYILSCDIGKPEQVVRNAGTDAVISRRVPPVKDVPLFELVAGSFQNVLARDLGPGIQEKHYILKLVAKTKSTARLIEGGSTPNATAQCLVGQPAIDQQIHGFVWRLDLNAANMFIPETVERFP